MEVYMFGRVTAVVIADLGQAPEVVGGSVDGAVSRLLDLTDHPKIEKWVQFPKALFVFLVVAGDPESGAFYVYDRHARIWFWVDFDDDKFGGYSVSDFDQLVHECRFLDLVEQPRLLAGREPWVVKPGSRPQRSSEAAVAMIAKSA
jgi:hypothetical protein